MIRNVSMCNFSPINRLASLKDLSSGLLSTLRHSFPNSPFLHNPKVYITDQWKYQTTDSTMNFQMNKASENIKDVRFCQTKRNDRRIESPLTSRKKSSTALRSTMQRSNRFHRFLRYRISPRARILRTASVANIAVKTCKTKHKLVREKPQGPSHTITTK